MKNLLPDLVDTITDEEAQMLEKLLAHRRATIVGYRDLSPEDVALVNRVKIKAQEVAELLVEIGKLRNIDPRWLGAGTLELQKGFMCVVRSITRPTSF